MTYPIILVPTCPEHVSLLLQKYRNTYDIAPYPLSRQTFSRHLYIYAGKKVMEKRTLQFGSLYINQHQKAVYVEGNLMTISPAEYEIFLALVRHVGEVLSRETLNQYLPKRQRITLRNVDTHVKNIRRKMGKREIVKCIRSVGYCIPVENICRQFRQISSL